MEEVIIQIDKKIVDVFAKFIDKGLERLSASIMVLMTIFAIFDLYIAMTSEIADFKSAIKVLGKKVIGYGFWFAVVGNYSKIITAIFDVSVNISNAFGEASSGTAILSIDKIAGEGFSIITKIMTVVIEFLGPSNIHYFFFYLIVFIIAFFFFLNAITSLVIAKIQFRLISGLGLILLVFVTLEFTKEIGMKAIQAIIHAALDIVVVYSIMNIAIFFILKEIPVPEITPDNNHIVDMTIFLLIFSTLMYMASQYKQITSMIMFGHGSLSGAGLGSSIASGITKVTTGIIVTIAAIYTGGGALAGAGAGAGTATGAGAGASAGTGSKIGEIFKGGIEGFKKSKGMRDTTRNVGNILDEGTRRVTGAGERPGRMSGNTSDLFNRFKKKKKNDSDEEET